MQPKLYLLRMTLAFLAIMLPCFLNAQNAPVTTLASDNACTNGVVSMPISVSNFSQITAVSLRIDFNPSLLNYNGYSNLNNSLTDCYINTIPVSPTLSKIMLVWSDVVPVNLTDLSVLINLDFTLLNGSPVISFNNSANGGAECEYANAFGNPLLDMPSTSFYTNATINNLGLAPAGAIIGESTVYQGQGNIVYSVPTIPNATSYIWQLPTGFTGSSSTNSITISVDNNALSGNISVKGHNSCGEGSPAFLYVNVFKQITIKLFLEGLFNTATSLMNQTQDQFGNHFGSGIADKLDLELHNSFYPFSTIYSIHDLDLLVDGNCTFSLPSGFQDSYYIVIKHRNHLETWSSTPVSFSGISANYDFTNSNSKAFGGNQKQLALGKFGLFAGDVNKDGSINQSDLTEIGSNALGFFSGYVDTDVNGDGVVDAIDLIMTDNNAASFKMVLKP